MPEEHFKSINQIIAQLAYQYGITDRIQEERLFSKWEEIVGVSLANRCIPKCIEQEVLFIEASNDFWKKVMLTKKKELLQLIHKNIDNNFIKDIQFI